MKRIPIKAAKEVAEKYGYDQVMIYGRKVGENGGEHMTTYGVDKKHCSAIGLIAKAIQKMIWSKS